MISISGCTGLVCCLILSILMRHVQLSFNKGLKMKGSCYGLTIINLLYYIGRFNLHDIVYKPSLINTACSSLILTLAVHPPCCYVREDIERSSLI